MDALICIVLVDMGSMNMSSFTSEISQGSIPFNKNQIKSKSNQPS